MNTSTQSRADGSTSALMFDRVTQWYGDLVAVNDVSFAVEAGITGLLGPNGAGKSTLLHLAAGLRAPSAGRVLVHGEVPTGPASVYARLGLVPEREALPGRLTVRRFVEARATLLGIPHGRDAAQAALAAVELDAVADQPIRTFSKGMRQRAKLAAALVHDPDVLLLDEPFNGLDPRQRVQMIRLLESRARNGATILLSSHLLDEIEDVATRVVVMVAGRLAASGDHRMLRRLMTDRPHVVRVRTEDPRVLGAALLLRPEVLSVEVGEHSLTVRTSDYTAFARQLVRLAQREAITVYEVQPVDESLEHVFTYLVNP